MDIQMFITIFTVGAAASALFTQAIKKAYENAGKQYSANIIALINAAVIGGLGTAAAYALSGIPWTVNNVIYLLIMVVTVWVASMIGYDKVIETIEQLKGTKGV